MNPPGSPTDDRRPGTTPCHLTEGARRMVGDREFSWIDAQIEDGDNDHLLVATSMPWLLPPGAS